MARARAAPAPHRRPDRHVDELRPAGLGRRARQPHGRRPAAAHRRPRGRRGGGDGLVGLGGRRAARSRGATVRAHPRRGERVGDRADGRLLRGPPAWGARPRTAALARRVGGARRRRLAGRAPELHARLRGARGSARGRRAGRGGRVRPVVRRRDPVVARIRSAPRHGSRPRAAVGPGAADRRGGRGAAFPGRASAERERGGRQSSRQTSATFAPVRRTRSWGESTIECRWSPPAHRMRGCSSSRRSTTSAIGSPGPAGGTAPTSAVGKSLAISSSVASRSSDPAPRSLRILCRSSHSLAGTIASA